METFAQLLTKYMARTGISDVEMARYIGVRRQTISRWKNGEVKRPNNRDDLLRCADKLRLTLEERHQFLLAAGATNPTEGRDIVSPKSPISQRESAVSCPYRGLFAFQETDAAFFYGRDSVLQTLTQTVQNQPFTAIIGSSGSGKSSLAFAGLVPSLRLQGQILIIDFRPGSNPFQAVAAALIPYLDPDLSEIDQLTETQKLAARLNNGELPLAIVIERILQKRPPQARLLILLDQFEELFTLCPEQMVRVQFLTILFTAIDTFHKNTEGTLKLVITLRADFLEEALYYQPLANALQDSDIKLGPMTEDELRQAIEQPALTQNVTFEAGLVQRILNDVGDEPGTLPLLEFALTTLWEHQRDHQLTHVAYEEIDRVEGALAHYADTIFETLSQPEQKIAQRIFVQLVHPGRGTEDTRRLATRSDLQEADWRLVQKLADARLTVTSRDATGSETVEVVHEALIRHWQRLRQWMEEDRQFRIWQERIRAMMHQWQATQQDEGALLRGGILAEAEFQIAANPDKVSQNERDFIGASLTHHYQEQSVQLLINKRLQKRAIWLSMVSMIALVLAVVAVTFGIQSRQSENRLKIEITNAALTAVALATEESVKATSQAEFEGLTAVSESRRLAAKAEDQFALASYDLALMLALEAVKADETIEAVNVLRKILHHVQEPLMTDVINAYPVTSAAWNATHSHFLTVECERQDTSNCWGRVVNVWNMAENSLQWSQTIPGINHAAWSPDGRQIMTLSFNDPVRIWRPFDNDTPVLLVHPDTVLDAIWSPDQTKILTADRLGTARIFNSQTGALVTELNGHTDSITAINWRHDNQQVLTAGRDKQVIVWDVQTGQPLFDLQGHSGWVTQSTWTSDGRLIATTSSSGEVWYWRASNQQIPFKLAGHNRAVNQALWNRSDSALVTAGDDYFVYQWDINNQTAKQVITYQPNFIIQKLAWNLTDDYLLTVNISGEAKVWTMGQRLHVFSLSKDTPVIEATWSTDSQHILALDEAGTIRKYWINAEDLTAIACSLLDDNMSWRNWQTFLPGTAYNLVCPSLNIADDFIVAAQIAAR
ncbi:MAG: helix-turn-helix domain-containing protein, partial [Chloroflexota bacterium]